MDPRKSNTIPRRIAPATKSYGPLGGSPGTLQLLSSAPRVALGTRQPASCPVSDKSRDSLSGPGHHVRLADRIATPTAPRRIACVVGSSSFGRGGSENAERNHIFPLSQGLFSACSSYIFPLSHGHISVLGTSREKPLVALISHRYHPSERNHQCPLNHSMSSTTSSR